MSKQNVLRSDRVVFLDIDGVLNSLPFIRSVKGQERLLSHLDPNAVRIFSDMIRVTGADVVLSSSWRIIVKLPQMSAWLRERGFTGRLIGSTPSDVRVPGKVTTPRGLEIQRWLDLYGAKVESFVILDDESGMEHLADRHVKTDMNVGLTTDHCALAIKMLREPHRAGPQKHSRTGC